MSDGGTATWLPPPPEGEPSGLGVLRTGTVLAGRFRLDRLLGSGGTGRVFEATDTVLGERVALKVLHAHLAGSRSLDRIRREIRLCRQDHPHAVRLFDLHGSDDLYFVTMELVEGTSLKDVLEARGALPVDSLVRIGTQISAALASFHARDLVHRDVKPGNILIGADGDARLCDMGLLRSISGEVSLTRTDMVLGTPAYMAPEQLAGGELTPASDVYALGLTLAQGLLEDIPDAAETRSVVRGRLRHRSISPRRVRPDCPRWLDRLVRRMTDPDPRERPTAEEVRRVLEAQRLRWRPRRRQLVAAAAGVAIAVLCGVVATAVVERSRRADRVDAVGTRLRGLAADGQVMWARSFPWPVSRVVRGDLDGDGIDEVIVASAIPPEADLRSGDHAASEVAVLDLAGRVRTRVQLPDVVGAWQMPFSPDINPLVTLSDLDGDGSDEVVVVFGHRSFYPGGLVVYWPSCDEWQPVLQHPGRIMGVVKVPGAERPTVQFLAVNNRLGMAAVVGEIELTAPSERRPRATDVPLSPRHLIPTEDGALRWVFYTPIGELTKTAFPGPDRLHIRGSGDRRMTLFGDRPLVDRWGNPAGVDHSGRDLRPERKRLWQNLGLLSPEEQVDTGEGVRRSLSLLRADAGPLLEEPSLQVIVELAAARAFARVGSLDEAVARLERLEAAHPWDEVRYRLAHLEGIRGRYREAMDWCRRLVAERHTTKGGYDTVHLMVRLAIAMHDPQIVTYGVERFTSLREDSAEMRTVAASVWARYRLWLDVPTSADADASSRDFAPAGDALACLVRWRLGHTLPTDPEAMAEFSEDNPDAAVEGRIAEAAALLGTGRAGEAVDVLEALVTVLEPAARDDFLNLQLLDLARALHATALEADGRREQAVALAAALVPSLDPGLLPGRLAREVLTETQRAR